MSNVSREQLLTRLRSLRLEMEREGVEHLALFGSRARGDNRPDSDVDLVVDVRPHEKFSLLDAIGVEHLVEDNLGLQAGVVVLDEHTSPAFLETLKRDRISIF